MAAVEVAREEARRLQIPYGELVVDNMVVAWLAMAGRVEEGEAALDRMRGLVRRTGLHEGEDAIEAAEVALAVWSDRCDVAADAMAEALGSPFPVESTVAAYRWRSGDEQAARDVLAEHSVELDPDTWFSPLDWSHAAFVALYTGDADLGRTGARAAAPTRRAEQLHRVGHGFGTRRRLPGDGSGSDRRPRGGRGARRRRARLCADWGLPVCAAWLEQERARYGF